MIQARRNTEHIQEGEKQKTGFLATAGPQPPRQCLHRLATEDKCAQEGLGRKEEKELLQK